MSITRRGMLTGLVAATSSMALSRPGLAFSGAINANSEGLRAGATSDQGALLQSILNQASILRKPVFLEPGQYQISNVTLPEFTHLEGISGATKINYGGGDHFVFAERGEHVSLNSIDFDGGLVPMVKYADAAIHLNQIKNLAVTKCRVSNAAGSGMHITGSTGAIDENRIDGIIGPAGFIGHNNNGLRITANIVEDCANGGILVHRWNRGADNSIVTQNRIRRIAAIYGGTGQWGNGINTYLADGVIMADNHVSDCAFSTIRSNSCSNIQISDNTCLRAGETSVYSEFAFEGVKITGNIVEGGATGISMANFNEGGRMSVCANNIVKNMHAKLPYEADGHIHGSGIYAEADTVINGNVIESTENFGIMMGWGAFLRNVLANSNIIRKTKSGFYVSVVEGIGTVSIADNIMSKLSGDAIVGYQWHDAVTADLAKSGASGFPTLEISGNRTAA